MGRTECDPARLVLRGGVALDKPLCVQMDETHTVVIPGDGGVGRQNGVLAVGAEHFGSWRRRRAIDHCLDLGQFVFIDQIYA